MGIGSIVSGAINAGRGLPTLDLSALFDTLNKSGQYQKDIINQLPDQLKPLYQQYQDSLAKAGTGLQTATTDIGKALTDKTAALYDPNSAAVQATLAALKQQDYSTLPGTLTNLKAQLAATGGLSRGGAGKAITQAALAPAATFSGQAGTVEAQQLQAGQAAKQAAINKVAQLDEQTAQDLFGMSKQEATELMTTGRSDLQQRMTDLVNQSIRDTSSRLGLQGLQAQNAFQNAQERLKQKNALTSDIVDTGINGLTSAVTGGMGGGGFSGAGMGFLKGLGLPSFGGGGGGGGVPAASDIMDMG
jgi:hypothetical protein